MLRRLQPHVPGLIYAALLSLVGLAAMNNQNNLLFWVFGVMVAGLAISAFISTLIMWSLGVRRLDPHHGAVGEPLTVRYAVTNRSRILSAFNLHIEERPPGPPKRIGPDTRSVNQPHARGDDPVGAGGGVAGGGVGAAGVAAGGVGGGWARIMPSARAWIMDLGQRETVHGEAVFWPTRRGKVSLDRIRVWTTFPFGIIRKSIAVSQAQHTLVYPRLYELRRNVLSAIAPAGLMGTRISQHAGAGDDYFGIREFKPGDSLRHIAWKRTAQIDELVTIERTSPSPAKVRVILDLSIPTQKLQTQPDGFPKARELEEQAISLAASIIHAADLDGYEVGLTVLGVEQAPIPLRRNQWH